MTYTLTVNIAPSLTSASVPGHMWYSISDGSSTTSYGFEPIVPNSPHGSGQVETSDNTVFQGTNVVSQIIQITQSQYNTLQAFGQAGVNAPNSAQQIITGPNNVSFDLLYNGLSNSCIDFTWAALATIGIAEPSTLINPRLIPSENEGSVSQALANFEVGGFYTNNTFYTYDPTGNITSVVLKDNNGNVVSTTSYQYNWANDSYTATTTNGVGSITGISTGNINTSTGATSVDVKTFLNGAQMNEQQINSGANGILTANVSGTGAQVNLPSATVTLANGTQATVTDSNNGTSESAYEASNGSGTFTDMSGDIFASYTSGQLTGSTIQISGNEINVYNSSGQIQNSTQEISVGNSLNAVLDNVYSGTGGGISTVNVSGQNATTALYLNDSGAGIAVSNGNTYFYQNGTSTAINIPGISPNGTLLATGRIFVDNNNEIIANIPGSGTVIYSGAGSNFTGGTTSTLLGPNGQAFGTVTAVSPNGNLILGLAVQSTNTVALYSRTGNTTSTVTLPTYTYADGSVALFTPTAINDNGLVLGAFTQYRTGTGTGNLVSIGDQPVSGIYNTHTGTLTVISDPNASMLSGVADGGTQALAINDSGEVVGNYRKVVNVSLAANDPTPSNTNFVPQTFGTQAFSYNNGVYTDVNIPGVTPKVVFYGTNYEGNVTTATGVTSNGTITVAAIGNVDQNGNVVQQNGTVITNGTLPSAAVSDDYIVSPGGVTDTSTLNILANGVVDLRSVSQITAPTTVNLAAGNNTVYVGAANETIVGTTGNNAFNVTSATAGATINAGSGQNVLNVSGGGTVTMGSNMTGIQTVNLAAPPSGQTQTAYNFTSTTNAGLTIVDSSNDTGDTISIYGMGGTHTITIQDTITNSSGANYNNTINAGNTSGNNTLAVGDGSHDLIRTDFSTGNNTLTAGNGSNDYLDATSSHGVNNLTVGSGSNNILDVSFGAGNDTLTTMTGSSDWLDAESSSGNNTLVTGNGTNNQLDTSFSSGNNTLTAGNGSNTYLNAGVTQGINILRAGDGNTDTLDVGFSTKNNTLTAGNGNGDYLTANSSSGNNILTAGNGSNDIFSAVWSTGQNTFNAGTGTTTFYGGEGYTTYRVGSTFGQDVLWNSGSSAGQGASTVLGEVDFGAGETSQNLWFTQSGSDLVVRLLGTSDTITIKGWFGSNAGAQVQAFYVSNGFKLSNTAVAALVTAMANYQTAHSTFNPAAATSMPTDTTLQSAITSAWVRYYDSTTTNGDGSWVGTLNDRFNGNWQSIKDYYTSANVLKESYELFNDGTATDTAKTSGITLTSNDTVGETLNTSSAGGDTVNVAAGSQYTVNATDAGSDVINAGSGNTVNINNNGGTQEDWVGISGGTVHLLDHSWADIYGGSNTITVGQNAAIGVQSGNNNNLTVGNGSYVYVNGGTGDTITSTGATIFEAAGVSMNVIGEGNVIYAANGSTMSIAGNGDYANDDYVQASNSTITIADNSRVDVYGGGNTITAGQNDVIGVQNGNGNSVTIGGNGTIYVNSGNSDTIFASNETVNAQSGVTVTVSGGNDIVYAANGDTVNVTGNGQYGADNYVVQSSGTVTVANNAHADIYGGGNTVTVGQNALLGIQYGNNNTITMGSNSQIYVNDGSTETINGGGNDQYNFASTFGQDTINNGTALTTANGSVGFGSGVTDENLWFKHVGNNLEIDLVGTSDKITISNWYGANAGAQVQGFDAGGLILDTQIAQLVSAMAAYVSSTGYNPTASGSGTTIPGGSTSTAAQTLQNAIAASWHH
jgi:hypothetical protein